MSEKDEIDKNVFVELFGAIADASKKEQEEKSVVYRDLKAAKEDSVDHLFSVFDLAASEVTISMADVVQEKYGINRISDDLYNFLSSYNYVFRTLTNKIEKEQGSVCCVDKAYGIMMSHFKKLIESNLKEDIKKEVIKK